MRKLFLCGLLCSFGLFGADFTGVWVGQIPTGRDGALQDVAFKITQNGTTLGGKMYGDYQSSPISEARVSGDLITFVVVAASQQNGNEINTTRLRFTGNLKDGALELTRDREASNTAGNGGTFVMKGNVKQSFRLKRLY
jgi:hypothetical protein